MRMFRDTSIWSSDSCLSGKDTEDRDVSSASDRTDLPEVFHLPAAQVSGADQADWARAAFLLIPLTVFRDSAAVSSWNVCILMLVK